MNKHFFLFSRINFVKIKHLGYSSENYNLKPGIQPALRPVAWENVGTQSATIKYDVFYPENHDFTIREHLPGFYFDREVKDKFKYIETLFRVF